MKKVMVSILLFFSFGAQCQDVNYYLSKVDASNCSATQYDSQKECSVQYSDNTVHNALLVSASTSNERFKGIDNRLDDHAGFFASSIGVIGVMLTIVSIVIGYVVVKQARKIDEIYRTYSEKLNELSKN